ncbi:MAG TPA: HD domain-containing phosphohydrolase [Candidatus Sulfotelmatobacter sp.]|nr:HD domain-containing phosphohydrolase [Candidatus Sulfotelmatobacter sp.]
MGDKILFVADDPGCVISSEAILQKHFEVDTAPGAEEGLTAIRDRGPYAVVISDMRMPGMNGTQFLARVRETAPDTVRMMVAGYSDINAIADAVNGGQLFRLLVKPCEPEALSAAVSSGLAQYRLAAAKTDLLDNTLMGSIKILSDILCVASPEAFDKSIRIMRCVSHVTSKVHLFHSWCFGAAAMLSQLGCITLDQQVVRAAFRGTHLSAEDRTRFEAHPGAARDILATVRRLEPVAWMIAQQLNSGIPQNPAHTTELPAEALVFGARMLRVAVAFDNLRMSGIPTDEAVIRLRYRSDFDRRIVDALADMTFDQSKAQLRKVSISSLPIGAILQQDVRNRAGVLVVAKGQEVTNSLRDKLEHFSTKRSIDNAVLAFMSP